MRPHDVAILLKITCEYPPVSLLGIHKSKDGFFPLKLTNQQGSK